MQTMNSCDDNYDVMSNLLSRNDISNKLLLFLI